MSDNQTLPLLAVRDVVVYPHMQIALFVGREKSIRAIEVAQEHHHGLILLVSQKDSLSEEIDLDNLHQYGTLCKILSALPHDGDGKTLKLIIEGMTRTKVTHLSDGEILTATFEEESILPLADKDYATAQKSLLIDLFGDYADSEFRNAREIMRVATRIEDLRELVYFVATRIALSLEEKQQILNGDNLEEHLQLLHDYLTKSKTESSLEEQLQQAVRRQMENNHREYFLNEKMKAIKAELSELNGNKSDDDDEDKLSKRLKEADLPEHVRKVAESEFKKLNQMPSSSSEASVVRGYLEWILDTPWNKTTKTSIRLDKAKETLDADHYGLADVKDRILEYLAVQSRVKKIRGPVLCLVGPPGVGKTSLGESIAKATGRKFVRVALGGVRDEAEIRGHRRTYIGAMPGKIVQSLAKAEVKNPLFLLDEIDKMGQDHRDDPASALLEVLDPSQNSAFNDHYLDLDLDLSEVMFICTANSMNIPPALLDRMEVIRLPGYTEDEKLAIAQNYLTPKALEQNSLEADEIDITDEALTSIIRHYTREAGVRNLEREINKISRKAVRSQVEAHGTKHKKGTKIEPIVVNDDNIADFLGVKPYDYGLAEQEPEVGRITGLAWTSVGGELLTIETATMSGKGELIFTGSLGDVMKESIRAAMSVVRAGGDRYGISYDKIKETDIHIHMPEGATPKDGPSAGIALTTALVSALTGIAIRPDIAMTGEVTLRGKVLRIGGLKEKLLAAHRGGIKLVLIPKSNERDLADVPDNIKEGLEIHAVEHIDEVLNYALMDSLIPLSISTPSLEVEKAKVIH